MLHDDRRRAGSFGEDADLYDRMRPGYPESLIDGLLADGAREVLDVGCGTGKVARQLLDRGCHVLGVEPDERMAAVAQRHGVTVEVTTIEAWDPRGRTFDLAVSGQAWHWVEPVAGTRKLATALRPGGRVAVFWSQVVLPSPVKARFEAVYRRVAPEVVGSIALGNIGRDRIESAAASFGDDGGFDHVEVTATTWPRSCTRREWLDLLLTYSDHRLMPAEQFAAIGEAIGEVIDEFGGSIELAYETASVTAVRRPR